MSLVTLSALATLPDIRHVVVLMEENLSFDHVFGFASTDDWKVNGLKGNEYNLVDTGDASKGRVIVSKDAEFINPCDPDHSTSGTSLKIFGGKAGNRSDPTMGGFVEREASHCKGKGYAGVMKAFDTSKQLPVMYALAREYALFDEFFCSHPGPTWPNRQFMLSATSAGATETSTWFRNVPGQLFPQRTVFDQLTDANKTWKNYYNDTPWELFMEAIAHNPEHTRPLTEFFADAAAGSLPHFSWINPAAGINETSKVGSNDQHPDHDVRAGEQLYKAVYEALRAGPGWNHTLFVLTYDEHGGFYDHVPPPMEGVPNPGDGFASYPDDGFSFERLGVRIPTVLASPWIPKSVVESAPPPRQKPQPSSRYDLTSIMGTMRKLLGMSSTPPLTKRDAWSATFEHLLSLSEPRTDCPMHLPDAVPPAHLQEASRPLNDLQKHIGAVHAHLAHAPLTHPDVRTPLEHEHRPLEAFTPSDGDEQRHHSAAAAKNLAGHTERQQRAALTREASLREAAAKYRLVVRPHTTGHYMSDNEEAHTSSSSLSEPWACQLWNFSKPSSVDLPWVTVRTVGLNPDAPLPTPSKWFSPLCLDHNVGGATRAAAATAGAAVGVSACGPGDGTIPSDVSQRWLWQTSDVTLRPYSNQSLCFTNHLYTAAAAGGETGYEAQATLEVCNGAVNQHWAYNGGAAPGDKGNGAFEFGCGANVLGLVRKWLH